MLITTGITLNKNENTKGSNHEVDNFDDLTSIILKEKYSLSSFKDGVLLKENFVSADSIGLDFDEYYTLKQAKVDFKDFMCVIATTKSHQKKKGTKPAQDRFRVIVFLTETIQDIDTFYATYKKLQDRFDKLDHQCKNPNRWFYPSKDIILVNKTGSRVKPVTPEKIKPKENTDYINVGKGKLSKNTVKLLKVGLKEGERNHSTFKIAKDFQENGFEQEDAIKYITKALSENGTLSYDFTEHEVQHTIESAYTSDPSYGPRQPFKLVSIEDLYNNTENPEWLVKNLLEVGGVSLWSAVPKAGKCLGRGTKLLDYHGNLVNVESLSVGDKLMGPDSKPRNVLATNKSRGVMYRITPVVGLPFTCNLDHILVLTYTAGKNVGEVIEISLKEYMKLSNAKKRQLKMLRARIDFPKQPVKYDPYMLGVWLGDGTKSCTDITNCDPEITKYIKDFCKKHKLIYHERPNKITKSISTKPGKPNPFLNYLRDNFIKDNQKIIPDLIKKNDRQTRLEFIAGLLDTDGNKSGRGNYEITQKSKDVAESICYILRSLGFKCSLNRKIGRIKSLGFEGVYWRVMFSGKFTEIPFRVKRRKIADSKKNPLVVGFKVEKIGVRNYYGFTLDGDERAVLEDFIVTHNSWLIRQLIAQILMGETFLDRETKKGEIHYYAIEESPQVIKKSFKKFKLPKDVPLYVHVGNIFSKNPLEDFYNVLKERKPVLAVIDTMFDFLDVESENNYKEVKTELRRLRHIARSTGTHIACIHHANKGNSQYGASGSNRSILGSTAIAGGVDTIVIIELEGETRIITVTGRDVKPIKTQKLDWNPKTWIYSLGDEMDDDGY